MSYRTVHVAVVPGETSVGSCGLSTRYDVRPIKCGNLGEPILSAPSEAEAYRAARQEDRRLRAVANTKFRFHG